MPEHEAIDLLVVDDDASFCQVLMRALTRRQLRVACAHDLDSALKLAIELRPRRALVDLKLADTSGLQVISALKEQLPGIAIVMLTGYSSIATAVEAVKRGATNYLCKPVGADEILEAFALANIEAPPPAPSQPLSVDRLEWEHIQKVLLEHEGNISATARALGMHRRTLQRKLQKRPVRQ
jgi:two-component system, response regulator RegA